MKFSKLLEQELEPTPGLSVEELININRNIDEYLKYVEDLGDEQRETYIQTVIRMIQGASRKGPRDNKLDGFIRKLYSNDQEQVNKVLNKIKRYNVNLITSKRSD